jgi:beta-glucanase (GH16 family)
MTGPRASESTPIFFDDFSSGRLDPSKWTVRTTGQVFNDEQQAYVDSPETVYVSADAAGQDGYALVLHPRYRPGHVTSDRRRFDFTSGRIDTRERFRFTYGTASARIKLSAGPGLWPAFWMLGAGRWPDTGEIDVMEFVGERDWVSCAVHGPGYSGEAGLANTRFLPEHADATEWHVYTVHRAPDAVTFDVDGTTVYRVTRPMVEFFGRWAFDDEKFLILNFALGGTYPFKTNGIHSPYYGLPEETVAEIRHDEARMWIDWVRVDGTAGLPTDPETTT